MLAFSILGSSDHLGNVVEACSSIRWLKTADPCGVDTTGSILLIKI